MYLSLILLTSRILSKYLFFFESFNWLETITTIDMDSPTSTLYDALYFGIWNFVHIVKFFSSKFLRWSSEYLKFIFYIKNEDLPNLKSHAVLMIMKYFRTFGHIINHTYIIIDSNIPKIACLKDLGIIFNEELDYKPHIDYICCSASKTLGFVILKSKELKFSISLTTIYYSLVFYICAFSVGYTYI